MNPTVFIQANANGEPNSSNDAAAERGFVALGFAPHRFLRSEMHTLPLSPQTVMVGGIGCLHEAWERMNVRIPGYVSAPAVLTPFLGRASWRTTPDELREAEQFPVFVKPYTDNKMFNGQVVYSAEQLAMLLESCPNLPVADIPTLLLAQEPVVFVSEWRVFVVRGRAVGIANYRGDLLTFPASHIVRAALGSYTNAPAGYSADFGVTDAGRTVLVETNDGYALGFMGGMSEARYAELLLARWSEVTGA